MTKENAIRLVGFVMAIYMKERQDCSESDFEALRYKVKAIIKIAEIKEFPLPETDFSSGFFCGIFCTVVNLTAINEMAAMGDLVYGKSIEL